MLEILLFGGIGYAITWYKGAKVAVWSGVGFVVLTVVVLVAVLSVWAEPIGDANDLINLIGAFLTFGMAGLLTGWVVALLVGFVVLCYALGIIFAQYRKRRKDNRP
ncbi:hypothetical protein [Pseudooctadecabacter sp.]|uniref:hypothetical protein n=1 Tax=Pseudooctadecabacter sp. TaxID=1966338 RepID=UPI0035C84446